MTRTRHFSLMISIKIYAFNEVYTTKFREFANSGSLDLKFSKKLKTEEEEEEEEEE